MEMSDEALVELHQEYTRWQAAGGINPSFESFLYHKRLEEDAVRWRYLMLLGDRRADHDAFISWNDPMEYAGDTDYTVVLEAYEALVSEADD